MKQFVTAVAQSEPNEDGEEGALEFDLDGRIIHIHRPSDGQLGMVIAGIGPGRKLDQKIAHAINFFVGLVDDEDYDHVVGRLMDRKDPFNLPQVEEIIKWLVEEWTGNPTRPPSGSTPSRRSGGRN